VSFKKYIFNISDHKALQTKFFETAIDQLLFLKWDYWNKDLFERNKNLEHS